MSLDLGLVHQKGTRIVHRYRFVNHCSYPSGLCLGSTHPATFDRSFHIWESYIGRTLVLKLPCTVDISSFELFLPFLCLIS
jgi:hypothetical protein